MARCVGFEDREDRLRVVETPLLNKFLLGCIAVPCVGGYAHRFRKPLLARCRELPFVPPPAQCFNQLHGDDETLAGKLCTAALGLQRLAARIDDFEITDEPGAIALAGEFGSTPRIRDGAILRDRLVEKVMNAI